MVHAPRVVPRLIIVILILQVKNICSRARCTRDSLNDDSEAGTMVTPDSVVIRSHKKTHLTRRPDGKWGVINYEATLSTRAPSLALTAAFDTLAVRATLLAI